MSCTYVLSLCNAYAVYVSVSYLRARLYIMLNLLTRRRFTLVAVRTRKLAISSRDTPPPAVDTRVNATSVVRRVRCRRSVLRAGACLHWKRRKSNGMRADAPEPVWHDKQPRCLPRSPPLPLCSCQHRTPPPTAVAALFSSPPRARALEHYDGMRGIRPSAAPLRQNRQLIRPQPCKYTGVLSRTEMIQWRNSLFLCFFSLSLSPFFSLFLYFSLLSIDIFRIIARMIETHLAFREHVSLLDVCRWTFLRVFEICACPTSSYICNVWFKI